MQKNDKKPNMEKQKTQEYRNPFDDIFFWLTLATTDFSFGLENGGNIEKKRSLSPRIMLNYRKKSSLVKAWQLR